MQLNVTYIPQKTNWSCAIACAEMVMRYHGLQAFDQVVTYNELRSPNPLVKGEWQVLNDDLLKKVRALGFQAEYLLFDYTDPADMMNKIRHHVSAGMPLIASQRAALNFPGGHSRLIVGFEDATSDGKEARVVVHDPSTVIRQGVPRGGSYVKWTASNFATFWKPKGVITTGGIAVAMRK